ncbi:molybdopterin-dependent oxidoreductase [Desulfosporosinus orientis]|uniref:molybdopterin-dependent oxidoreductase n=1 Tax=Desulfosporosinus orientis TaxID=1563 RepID=UPI001FA7A965|nr:molybdopterin-dependent oxidoreductase [Desulfosporosinus orientis]
MNTPVSFERSLPLDRALLAECILALKMNDQPLPQPIADQWNAKGTGIALCMKFKLWGLKLSIKKLKLLQSRS